MNNTETSLDEKSRQKAYDLFESGLIENREIIMKGIDYSYYYETEE